MEFFCRGDKSSADRLHNQRHCISCSRREVFFFAGFLEFVSTSIVLVELRGSDA